MTLKKINTNFLYIGQTTNLYNRLRYTNTRVFNSLYSQKTDDFYVKCWFCDNEYWCKILEAMLIKHYKPVDNITIHRVCDYTYLSFFNLSNSLHFINDINKKKKLELLNTLTFNPSHCKCDGNSMFNLFNHIKKSYTTVHDLI